MSFNLIHDAWIPVRRKDGTRQRIRPEEITDQIDANPIIALDAPRPDFNGALIQFLIGLTQTAMPPKHEKEWRTLFQNPPPPDSLLAAFEPLSHAFNLDGDGPRFMQEIALADSKSKKHPVSYLLMEAPGDNTLKENKDHFIKRESFQKNGKQGAMCLTCVATATFTLQSFAPGGGGGGGGKNTSLRGGGPLTTILLAENLWRTTWLNILNSQSFPTEKNFPEEHTFPWLKPEKFIKAKTKRSISSESMNPQHVFWNMPRRIKLKIEKGKFQGCFVCGKSFDSYVVHYMDATEGLSYFQKISKTEKKASWIYPPHPQTSYCNKPGKEPAAITTKSGGITYRHWLGLVQDDDKKNSSPAANVTVFKNNRYGKTNYRLWAFGYDMDKRKPMKARCWYESEMPLILVDENIRESYELLAAGLVRAAEEIAYTTRTCLKKAWFNRPGDVKGDFSFIDTQFWQSTEPEFYKTLERGRDQLLDDEDTTELRHQWLKMLSTTAETIFDALSQNGQFDAADPKRIALAWKDLKKFTSGKNEKLRKILFP